MLREKQKKASHKTNPLSIRANMLWNSAGSFIYMFAQWLTTVLIVRLSTGFEAAGVYTYIMSVYMIFSSIAEYRMFAYQVSDSHNEFSMGEYFTFKCLTCGLSIVITMLYAFATSEPSLWLPLFIYLIYKDLSIVIDTFHAQQQKEQRMDYMGISIGWQGISSLLCFWLVFGLTQNLVWTFLSMALSTLIIGVLYDYPRAICFSTFNPKISFSKIKTLFLRCLPAVIAFVMLSASCSVPRQFLLNIMGDSALGSYGTIAAPLAIIQTCASYIFNPLLGYFSTAYESKDFKRFLKLMGATIGGTIAIGIICAVALFFLGNLLYSLIYGPEILNFMYLIPLLIISSLTISFATFINTLMVALRNFKATFIGGLVALSISLFTMVPLIHFFQLNGVTIAIIASSTLSTLVMSCMLAWQIRSDQPQ